MAIDGKIVYKHHGRRFISDSNHIVILPKNQDYDLECIQSGKITLINFLLNTDIPLDTFRIIEISKPEKILALHKKAEEAFRSYQSSRHAKMQSCLYEIIATIIDEQEKNSVPPVLKKALMLLESQISDTELSNTYLASELHISEIYLRKIFRAYLSKSPQKYIQSLR
ncbi:MAG: hypothetical protein IJX80_00560 [Clostridia bacterium]|nr:hypothetical protein [Clostridia bacterium]